MVDLALTETEWRLKLLGLLHDGVMKHDAAHTAGEAGGSGHERVAKWLAEAIGATTDGLTASATKIAAADQFMTGADRAPFRFQWPPPSNVRVQWTHGYALAGHPLARAAVVLRDVSDPERIMPRETVVAAQRAVVNALRDDTPQDARRQFVRMWRLLRDTVADGPPPAGRTGEAWRRYVELHPADTRMDGTLWDHVRMTAAAAWVPHRPGSLVADNPRCPWLFTVEVGPVRRWVRDARTVRDLWTGSMLLAELSLASMQPIIEAFGPDAILYPDLCGNRRFDHQLAEDPELASAIRREPVLAALIPASWVALVPHGSPDSLKALGARVREAAQDRWRRLGQSVQGSINAWAAKSKITWSAAIDASWADQIDGAAPDVAWTAVPWLPPESGLPTRPSSGRSLPAQTLNPHLTAAWSTYEAHPGVQARRRTLGAWVNELAWKRAEDHRRLAASQFGKNVYSLMGADYGLVHGAIRGLHKARKLVPQYPPSHQVAAEACTQCRSRAALGADATVGLDESRRKARELWTEIGVVVHAADATKERLCGVCATKRFLVPPSRKAPEPQGDAMAFLSLWSFAAQSGEENRLPSPSTAAAGNGAWLAHAYADASLPVAHELARCLEREDWPRTFFPASMAATVGIPKDHPLRQFEPTFWFEGPRDADRLARGGKSADRQEHEATNAAIGRFRDTARAIAPNDKLDPRIAVISVDGDSMGKLISGDPARIIAKWRDVLHPEAVAQLEQYAANPLPDWVGEWREQLSEVRATGPSLHAWISRALTYFANEVVPWVVEREFHGRLIYAGGDDVLALSSAAEAAPIAARLQQLWSAPWLLDTVEGAYAFRWREAGFVHDPGRDRGRFLIPLVDQGQLTFPATRFARHAAEGEAEMPPGAPRDGRVVPMLGPFQSVSAGIAYGHFKTPLGHLVEASDDALRKGAKQAGKGAAIAEALFTRSGIKSRSVVKWARSGESGGLGGWHDLRLVDAAFREGRLSMGLPYKLRELSALLAVLADRNPDELPVVGAGFVREALSDSTRVDADLRAAITRLWVGGVELWHERPHRPTDADVRDELPAVAADILAIRRELVSASEDT